MSSATNKHPPASMSVSDVELCEVPSDDIELTSSERSRSNATTSRQSWQELSYCELMLGLGILFVVTGVLVLSFMWVGMSRSNADDMTPAVDLDIPTFEETNIDETPRFRGPTFLEELRSVIGVDPEPDTPQFRALEWMAFDDLELFYYETVSAERLKQRYALAVFHIATGRWNKIGGWATPSGAREHECFWPGVSCDRDNVMVLALELDTFVGTLQGSIPSEVIFLSSLGTLSYPNDLLVVVY